MSGAASVIVVKQRHTVRNTDVPVRSRACRLRERNRYIDTLLQLRTGARRILIDPLPLLAVILNTYVVAIINNRSIRPCYEKNHVQ